MNESNECVFDDTITCDGEAGAALITAIRNLRECGFSIDECNECRDEVLEFILAKIDFIGIENLEDILRDESSDDDNDRESRKSSDDDSDRESRKSSDDDNDSDTESSSDNGNS